MPPLRGRQRKKGQAIPGTTSNNNNSSTTTDRKQGCHDIISYQRFNAAIMKCIYRSVCFCLRGLDGCLTFHTLDRSRSRSSLSSLCIGLCRCGERLFRCSRIFAEPFSWGTPGNQASLVRAEIGAGSAPSNRAHGRVFDV